MTGSAVNAGAAAAPPRVSIARAERVYLDSTVFFNFGEAGALIWLIKYLGDKARIVNEVEDELRRNSLKPEFSYLQTLDRIDGWPPVESVDVTPAQMVEVLDVKRVVHEKGDHQLEHLGEIASVIAARDDQRSPVVSDDGLARRMCSIRELPYLTSPDIAAEMFVAGALDRETAIEVFDSCCRYARIERDFDESLEAARLALA